MFVFADETGHSGRHIFNAPPLYKLGALLSVPDPEPVLKPVIDQMLAELGVERLHANAHSVEQNVRIAHGVMDVLDASGPWQFDLAEIDKEYVSVTKFVDLIFDNGENSAVPPHWYLMEIFRHALCLACDGILTPINRRKFWEAFLIGDRDGLRQCVRNARTYALRVEDPLLRKVIIEAFDFFLKKTECFTLNASGKKAYQGDTPNMIAFSILLQAVNKFAEGHNSPPIAFVHDRQDEFKGTMREWYSIFGPIIMDDDDRGWWPNVRKILHDLPAFTIAASETSPSLQTVDNLLWIERRESSEKALKECQERLRKSSNPYFITPWMSQMIMDMRWHQVSQKEFGRSDELRARSLLAEMEEQRQARIRAHFV
jgi:hypothetical protein